MRVQAINAVSTVKNHPLGTRVRAVDRGSNENGEGEFIYLKGVTNGAVGAWATYNLDDHSTTLLAANAIGPVGVMMAVLDASTDFGWLQIFGKAVGLCDAGFDDNDHPYAGATAGSVTDTVTAGDRVKLARSASDIDGPATGMAEFELAYPFMDDALAA